MKKFAVVLSLVGVMALSGCFLTDMFMGGGGGAAGGFDAKMMLGAMVQPNIKSMVDLSKAKVGQSCKQAQGPMTVAVVEDKGDGTFMVEVRMPMGANKTVVAYLADKDGNVKKAWGGLEGEEGTELDVPEPKEAPKAEATGDAPKPEMEEIGTKDIQGFSCKGTKVKVQDKWYVSYTSEDFPFFGGVMASGEEGKDLAEVEYKAEGAKCTLKIGGGDDKEDGDKEE